MLQGTSVAVVVNAPTIWYVRSRDLTGAGLLAKRRLQRWPRAQGAFIPGKPMTIRITATMRNNGLCTSFCHHEFLAG